MSNSALVAPVLLIMMAAVHGRAGDALKTVSSLAIAFMTSPRG